MAYKMIKQWVPAGPTVVWKVDSRTGKKVPVQVQRKGYYRTIKVKV